MEDVQFATHHVAEGIHVRRPEPPTEFCHHSIHLCSCWIKNLADPKGLQWAA